MQSIDFKRFMFEQKIKQKDLAEYLGLSKGYISLVISGDRPLSEENLRKLINNPFGWNTSILTGDSNEDVSSQTPAPSQEEPQERNSMLDSLLSLVESQRKDIETLIQLTKEKDNRIERLTQELLDAQQENNTLRLDLLMLTPNEKESAISAEDSLSASAI